MRKLQTLSIALATVYCFSVSLAQADVKLPSIFGDNMVLQHNAKLPFWGWADAGEKVTVTVGDHSASTTAGENGKWRVDLPAVDKTGPIKVSVAGNNSINYQNVLVGNNWVCSGQSNMAWSVERSNNPEEEIANANYPNIHMFKAQNTVAGTPQEDVVGQWVVCSPETIATHSAVGYFFGREVHKRTGQPVGLIESNWGGTPAEAWTTQEMMESVDELKPIQDRWEDIVKNHDSIMTKYKENVAKAKAAGKRAPRAPYNADHPHRVSGLYNGMINPLIPYAIQGAIWYQGESNAPRAFQYRTLFPAMIISWREKWGQGDFPFYFVQLANFRKVEEQPVESDWAELREAQSMTLNLENTGQAVIIDIGEADDIHPRNKQDVGYRLALIADNQVFGKTDTVYSGPVYKTMEVEGNSIRITFDHVGGGLVARGDKLTGFALAGQDRKFVWADAKIEGNSVVVSAEGVSSPVAVRYAWANNPVCNLYNAEGLPASPFRTDTFKGVTFDKK